MQKNKIIIYGDLHGCLDEFIALREKIQPSPDDREIVIGDIVDRGPHSNELFRYVRENGIESVLGNHEYRYLRYKKHNDIYLKTEKNNPMNFDERRLSLFNGFDAGDLEFLESLPFFIKIDNLTLLHAGILNNIDLESAKKKDLEKLLWIRYLKDEKTPLALGSEDESSTFWSELYDGKQGIIIYGHEAFKEVKVDTHSLGIDTGCVYGNRLTACIVSDTSDPMNNYELMSVASQKDSSL